MSELALVAVLLATLGVCALLVGLGYGLAHAELLRDRSVELEAEVNSATEDY